MVNMLKKTKPQTHASIGLVTKLPLGVNNAGQDKAVTDAERRNENSVFRNGHSRF